MIFIGAKDDCLLHPVSLLEIFGYLLGNLVCAVFNDDIVIEIAVGVDAVFDDVTEFVPLSETGPPPFRDVGLHIDNLERSKKTVIDSFPQTVRIDRFSEIVYVRYVLCFLGRRRHSDLYSRREIFKNPAPVAVFLRRAAVTFIDDDKIEEIPGEKFREAFYRLRVSFIIAVFIACKLLIKRKINFMRSDGNRIVLGEIDLVNRLFERSEILLYGLIDKYIAVGEIQHLALQSAFEKPIDNLERRVGFARACRHHKKEPILTSGDCLNRAVNCVSLIISWIECILAGIVRLGNDLSLVRSNAASAVRLTLPSSG